MIRFAAIRLVEILAMLVLMSFVIYALIGLMPGDPIDLMRSARPSTSRNVKWRWYFDKSPDCQSQTA